MRKRSLVVLVVLLVISGTFFALDERFDGMDMDPNTDPNTWLVPDVEDLYYVSSMSQGGLVLGYQYNSGSHYGIAGLNLAFVNLVGSVSTNGISKSYTVGGGLALGRLGVGVSAFTSDFRRGDVALDGGIASKELFVLGKITFPDVALNSNTILNEVKSKYRHGEYVLDAVARLHLGNALLISASYKEHKTSHTRIISGLAGLTLEVNHAYEKPVSKYYSKTEYQKLPTMIAGVYQKSTGGCCDYDEKIGVIAEGVVRPVFALRAGIFAVKSAGEYHYETALGAGLIFSNLHVDVNLTGFSGFDTLGVEVTLDGRKY